MNEENNAQIRVLIIGSIFSSFPAIILGFDVQSVLKEFADRLIGDPPFAADLARLQLLGADLSVDRLFGLVEICSYLAYAAKTLCAKLSHLCDLSAR
jgi:hypothetical protein